MCNQLYSYTQLQTTFGVILLAIVNGEPKILTLKDILQHYIDFQQEVVTRRTQYDLKKAQDRAHILEGLLTALDFIDEVINILRNSKSVNEGKEALMERFGLHRWPGSSDNPDSNIRFQNHPWKSGFHAFPTGKTADYTWYNPAVACSQ